MAGVDVACGVQGLLVERCGADGVHLSCHGEFGGTLDVRVRGVARDRRQLAPGQVGGEQAEVDHVDAAGGELGVARAVDGGHLAVQAEDPGGLAQPLRVADDHRAAAGQDGIVEQGRDDDLGADAGTVAHGDGDEGEGVLMRTTPKRGGR